MSNLSNIYPKKDAAILLAAMIIDKIKKKENINFDNNISVETINKYLPEIKKSIPDIEKYLSDHFCNKSKKSSDSYDQLKNNKQNKQKFINIEHLNEDKNNNITDDVYHKLTNKKMKKNKNNAMISVLAKRLHTKKSKEETFKHSDQNKSDSSINNRSESLTLDDIKENKEENSYNECFSSKKNNELVKIYTDHTKKCHSNETNEYLSSEENKNENPQSADISISKSDKKSDNTKSNINECIKKVKTQLDKISSSENRRSDESDDCINYDNKICIEHIENNMDENNEKNATNWDLCEFNKYGEFTINENLDLFHKKAKIIIACYKKKLLEFIENKNILENSLSKCRIKNNFLKEKIIKCNTLLEKQKKKKIIIIEKVNKCESELYHLIKKYSILEKEYHDKKNTNNYNKTPKNTMMELESIKNKLKCYEHKKKSIKNIVNNLQEKLNICKKNKANLLRINEKLKLSMKKCNNNNVKYKCSIKVLEEEICKLNNKLEPLVHQNKDLDKENSNLRDKLTDTLNTLKWLCDKYFTLKKKCDKKIKSKNNS